MIKLLGKITFGDGLSWALTIFSTLFAIYTWIVGKKRKELSVSCKMNEIIVAGKNNIDELDIKYKGQAIKDFTATFFYVWNSGNTVIYHSDIVNSRPICVKNTGNAQILNAQIIRVSEEANAVAIDKAEAEFVELSFDYIDEDEGFVIQILHSGSFQDLELDCKIKGGMGIRERSGVKRKKKESKFDYYTDVFFAALPTLLGFAFMILSLDVCILINDIQVIPNWISTILGMVCVVGGVSAGGYIGTLIGNATNKKFHRNIPVTLKSDDK